MTKMGMVSVFAYFNFDYIDKLLNLKLEDDNKDKR